MLIDCPDCEMLAHVKQTLEFSTVDDDEASLQSTPEQHHQRSDSNINGTATGGKKDSLEQLLLTRNKKLSNDIAKLMVAHQDIQC